MAAEAALGTNPWVSGFLLSLQASGMVVDLYNTFQRKKLIETGKKLEQEAFETNIQAIRLETEQQSVAQLQQLRQNLGTQIAVQAARGNNTGAGSSVFLREKSIGSYGQDERSRRLNLLAKESQLRANNIISGLGTLQSETELGQAMYGRYLNQINTSKAFDNLLNSDFANRWGFGNSGTKVK